VAQNILGVLALIWTGFRDSMSLFSVARFVFDVPAFRAVAWRMFIMNVVIMWGSHWTGTYIIPHVWGGWTGCLTTTNNNGSDDGSRFVMDSMFFYLFHLFWVFPAYWLCYILNVHMCNSLSSAINEHIKKTSHTKGFFSDNVDGVADGIHHSLTVTITYGQCWLLYHIPYVGKTIYWLCVSLLISFYCEDHAMKAMGYTHAIRRRVFESMWIYFMGFGFIPSMITLWLGWVTSSVAVAMFVPLGMTTLVGKMHNNSKDFLQSTVGNSPDSVRKRTAPFFFLPLRVSERLLSVFLPATSRTKKRS
jgi:hypothetical protein